MARIILIVTSLFFAVPSVNAFLLFDVIATDWIRGELILTCNTAVRFEDQSWGDTYDFKNSADTVKPYLKCLAEDQLKTCPRTGSLPRNEGGNYLGPFSVRPTEMKYQFLIPEYPTKVGSKDLSILQVSKVGSEGIDETVPVTGNLENPPLVLKAQVIQNESTRRDVWVLQKTSSKIEMIAFSDNFSVTGTTIFRITDGNLTILDTTGVAIVVEYGYCDWRKGEGTVPFDLDAETIKELKELLDSN
jgi:hypothetical protein